MDLTAHLNGTDSDSINQMKAGVYTITLNFDLTATQPGATTTRKFIVTILNDEAVKLTNPEKPGLEEPEEVENGGTSHTGLLKLDYAPLTLEKSKLVLRMLKQMQLKQQARNNGYKFQMTVQMKTLQTGLYKLLKNKS